MTGPRLTSNGRKWPTRKPRPDRWSAFRYLVIREAVFRLGEHPHLTTANETWRRLLANAPDDEVLYFFRQYEKTWPARLVRP